MSGIAGIIRFDGAPVEPGLVEKMTSAMAHRGPDGIRHWVNGSVALGQCMLRTTPESLEEQQPLTNEDESVVLVMDGRVDNWEDLRKELLGRGARLRTRSDAELVLRAYEAWGEDCLAHIDGDFALVVWDARRRAAFCARDRFGARQFVYHYDRARLAFCTEIHPLLALTWIPRVANDWTIAEHLAGDCQSNSDTLWRETLRLPAAHRMTVRGGPPRRVAYWEPDLTSTVRCADDREWAERYLDALLDSTRRLSRSLGRVSCEVSGGLDSSAVFCVLHHLQRSGTPDIPEIDGLTLAFRGNGRASEAEYARAVGDHLGVEVIEIEPAIRPLSWYAERAITRLNFPGYPNGVMSLTLLQRASELGSRVLFNGIGGDEWLGGTRTYYAEQLALRDWSGLWSTIKEDVRACGAVQTASGFLRQGCFPLLPLPWQRNIRRAVRAQARERERGRDCYWLTPRMQACIAERRAEGRVVPARPVARAGQLTLLGYLRDAHHHYAAEMTEQFAAEHQLEVRRPLYTRDLVQFAFASPERMRIRGDRNKYTHARALDSIVPARVLNRRSKAEFSIVFDEHIRQMGGYFVEDVPRQRPEWVTANGMRRLFGAYAGSQPGLWGGWPLWGLFGCDKVEPVLTGSA